MESRRAFDELSREQLLRAFLSSDASYDEVFFVGVTSTGIFCFPSCTCRKPRPENVRFLRTREEALKAGFRPCKRCLPDREGGKRGYAAEVVARVQALIDASVETATVDRLAAAVSLSPGYLRRLFREVAGLPLQEYIRRQRALRAARLLEEGELPVCAVSQAVGFEHESTFYSAFHRTLGMPPGEYRRSRGRYPRGEPGKGRGVRE